MRLFPCLCAVVLGAGVLPAQEPRESARAPLGPPLDASRRATSIYNHPMTLRAVGRYAIAAEDTLRTDIAVVDGPLTIAGVVSGDVAVINGDLLLRERAQIDGDIIVVGGVIEGRDEARIGGTVQEYPEPLLYREYGDTLVVEPVPLPGDRWRVRFGGRGDDGDRTRGRFTLITARTYNRVEGLPILLGPRLSHDLGAWTLGLDLLGIYRTADDFAWDSENLGHRVRAEIRRGSQRRSIAVGGRLFDVVDPVEEWHLTDAEVGLASFFLHRDYRDYYNRHGGEVFVNLIPGRDATVTLSYSDERWATRDERDPFSLFRNGEPWRENPAMDDGTFHIAEARLMVDTRNDVESPSSGWHIAASFERGTGRVWAFGPTDPAARSVPAPVSEPAPVTYSRGLFDVRRYNRVSPEGQLNMRLVLGGWLGGDELPLQRRFSVGGPGSLPGYDFRQPFDGTDVGTCSTAPSVVVGLPAQCERVALAQVEFRGDLQFDLLSFDRRRAAVERDREWHVGWDADAAWIVFLDAGRGWLVGPRSGELVYPTDAFPALSSFRSDVGLGLDLGIVGVYVAKALSDGDEPVNWFVRVRHRF